MHGQEIYTARFVSAVHLLALSLCFGCASESDEVVEADLNPPPEARWSDSARFEEEGALLNIWGDARGEVYAIGGQPEQSALFTLSDEPEEPRWRPLAHPAGPLLNWSHGVGTRQWVVGNEGRILSRRDAGEWAEEESTTTRHLWGVWAASEEEAWAVGGDPLDESSTPALLHYASGSWRSVELPPLDRGGVRALFKVWGSAADRVFAVGAKGILLAYDGSVWSQQTVTPVEDSPPITDDLISLWGGPDESVIVVGGRANGVIVRFDQELSWRGMILPGVPGLNGIWMDAQGVSTAVGLRGVTLRVEPGGFDFSYERSENTTLLHSVWGAPDGRRWAVGGSLDSLPPWEGVILSSP
ncbi:MAG: hypothetical protein VYD19_10255 [Myxococcota bacterium]|nr:hypothetical protein [Myxococcota bacterium]